MTEPAGDIQNMPRINSLKSRRLADLGEGPARKKRKYLQNDACIERIVGRYEECKEAQKDVLDGDWQEGLLKYLLTLGHSARSVFL